ncbi:MAG: hypothetical protein QOC89_1330, partial [Paraburkholderia sp.]|uniref:hypothetical protein n=1 Tax=Paraburkholderia sp. TaxID=1926495 RepID=UPI002AFE9A38
IRAVVRPGTPGGIPPAGRQAAMPAVARRKATAVVIRKVVAADPQVEETVVAAVAGHRTSTADRGRAVAMVPLPHWLTG